MAIARRLVELEDVRDLAQLLYSIADMEGWSQTAALFSPPGYHGLTLKENPKKPTLHKLPDSQEQLWPPGARSLSTTQQSSLHAK